MTDAVTKNLGIEETTATALGRNRCLLHLLCKSYTVEVLNRSNFEVLCQIEKQSIQREILEKIYPSLICISEARLARPPLSKQGWTVSLNLLPTSLQSEGKTKHIFMYQQRRFAKLIKAAAAILNAKE